MEVKLSIDGNLIIIPNTSIEVYAMRKWWEDNQVSTIIIRGLNEPDK